MQVIGHETSETLIKKARHKTYAVIKDRLRAVSEALKGTSAERIAHRLFVSTRSVTRWIQRWNQAGEEGLWDKPRPGQPQKLTVAQQTELFAHLERGPSEEEGRSRYRLIDLCAFVKERFGVLMKKGGMQNLLFRHGYRVLRARPVHAKNDTEVMEVWKKQAPLLSNRSKRNIPTKKSRSSSKMRRAMGKKEASIGCGQSAEQPPSV